MASTQLEAALVISARDRTRPGLLSAQRNVHSAAAAMQASAHRMFTGLGDLSMLLAGGVAAAGIYKIGQAALEGDAAMRRLAVTAGVTAREMQMYESAFALGATGSRTSVRELTTSVDGLVTAGLSLDVAARSAPTIAKTAKATGAAIDEVTQATVALISNLNFTPSNLERAMDMMVAGGKLGAFEVRDMAREFPGMAASAAKLGIQGERGLAMLVSMAQVVRQTTATGSEAATSLIDFMEKLASPDVGKNLKKLGVDVEKVFKDAKGDGVKFTKDMLQEIQRITQGDPFKLAQIFGDKEARAAAAALLRDLGKLDEMIGQVANSTGEMGRDFEKQTKGAAAGIERMTAAWQTWLSVVSKGARPALDNMSNIIAKALEKDADARTVQNELPANLEQGAKGKPFTGITADTVGVLREINAENTRILKGRDAGWVPAGEAIDATRVVGRYYGARQAYRDGRMPIEEFHGAADPYERRRAELDRREAFYLSRGGDRTDAQMAKDADALRTERAAVAKEANDPAIAGMVREMAKERLAEVERKLKALEGFIKARAEDTRPKTPGGGTTVPAAIPTPSPRGTAIPTPRPGLAVYDPTDVQAAIDRANRIRPGSRVKDDLVVPSRPSDVFPGFDMAFDAPAVAGPNRPRRPARGFNLAYGPEDLPTAAVGKSALQLAGVFDEATGIIATATSALSKFRPPTQKETWGLKEPWPMDEKPGGGYRSRINPGGTPMTFYDGGGDGGAVDDLGAKLRSAGDAFISALRSPGTIEAVVTQPVKAQLEGRASVDVRVAVTGGQVVSARSSSSGHIQTNVGTSMPHLNRRPDRRDE